MTSQEKRASKYEGLDDSEFLNVRLKEINEIYQMIITQLESVLAQAIKKHRKADEYYLGMIKSLVIQEYSLNKRLTIAETMIVYTGKLATYANKNSPNDEEVKSIKTTLSQLLNEYGESWKYLKSGVTKAKDSFENESKPRKAPDRLYD